MQVWWPVAIFRSFTKMAQQFSTAALLQPGQIDQHPLQNQPVVAGPAFFLGLRRGWIGEFGTAGIGLLPVILAVLVLAVAFAARRRTVGDPATQRVATVWLAAVAAGFVTLAIPLQLRNEWITIGGALITWG